MRTNKGKILRLKPQNDRVVKRDSSAKAFRMTKESGRSMVEMLGVLAVVGVLSIGGIIGYNMAMNRHRANELLDGVSKRAVVVASQIAFGKSEDELSVEEFTDPTGYEFDVATEGLTNQFAITLNTSDDGVIEETICNQIKNVLGDDHINPSVNDDCSEFIYNNDLSTGSGGGESGSVTCPEERKYTFRNVEMCCPHALSETNQCASETEDGCDGELGIDGHTCCATDGSYQNENGGLVWDFSKCGCPDDMYYYDNDCHTCKKGECTAESKTFVAGAIGTWDELSAMTNNGCPTGYHWADKSTTETNLEGILDGSLCGNCGLGRPLWTSTPEGSVFAWSVNLNGPLASNFRGYDCSALCEVE